MGRLVLILSLFAQAQAFAGSCCGQSATNIPVLSMGQKYFLSSSIGISESLGRIYDNDEFIVWDDKERSQINLGLTAAGNLNSRWQWLIRSKFTEGSYKDSVSSGTEKHLGDSLLAFTYEALPEYDFNLYKPIVHTSLLLNLPTGNSIYDKSDLGEGAGVTGYNQWGLGFMLSLSKAYHPIQIKSQIKSLKLFSKQFSEIKVSDYFDNSISIEVSYALKALVGANLSFGMNYQQLTERTISPGSGSSEKMESSPISLSFNKSLNNDLAWGISYTDESIIGKPKNTLLGRSLNFNISKNYY